MFLTMSNWVFSILAGASRAIATRLCRDERGATAVEYGLIVALIAGVIIAIVATLGGQIANAFSSVSSQM